jgi:hypothetical protein
MKSGTISSGVGAGFGGVRARTLLLAPAAQDFGGRPPTTGLVLARGETNVWPTATTNRHIPATCAECRRACLDAPQSRCPRLESGKVAMLVAAQASSRDIATRLH